MRISGTGHSSVILSQRSKIEKVPWGIWGEKSSKDMASSRNLVSTIGALASPKMGDKQSSFKSCNLMQQKYQNKLKPKGMV